MKKIEAESKSQQRRLKEQTGQDVPLSARAEAAIAEHLPPIVLDVPSQESHDAIKDALRPGRKSDAAKPEPVKSPILGLTEGMRESTISYIFQTYQGAERASASKALDEVTSKLGRQVNALDKQRQEQFEEIKKSETKELQDAQKEYQRALREAKGSLDRDNARIKKTHEQKRSASREVFDSAVAPINEEMTKTKTDTTAAYAGKVAAAIAESQPFVKAARKREEERVAALRKKNEEEAAAKAAAALVEGAPIAEEKIPASPHFVGASTAKKE